jgi:glycolate oxidase FAD binding subunit
MRPAIAQVAERIRDAAADRRPLCIRGGGTKDFYGNTPSGERLGSASLSGIVDHQPSELVLTALGGTPLADIEASLLAHGQMLAFEPPHFGPGATIGGCVAAGLAGPRRSSSGPTHGGVRDFVLGARLVDGSGRLLSFGGTVMKNVAGYDVSRALAGSLGILGLIVEVSIKVLPRPTAESSLRLELGLEPALERLRYWGGQALPISASAWVDGCLFLRLSGSFSAVSEGQACIGGEAFAAEQFWSDVREQQHPFFREGSPLWRIALPATAPALDLGSTELVEWNGTLRWIHSDLPAEAVRARAGQLGGYATLFRGGDRSIGVFPPLPPALLAIHRRLKAEFDPAGILNPGRMYAEL